MNYPYVCCKCRPIAFLVRRRKGGNSYHAFCVNCLPQDLQKSQNWFEVSREEWAANVPSRLRTALKDYGSGG